jgi:hypothetical protein
MQQSLAAIGNQFKIQNSKFKISSLCLFICIVSAGWAQTGNEVGKVQDDNSKSKIQNSELPAYIFDGENPSHAWGSQETGGKIVIGLTDEGFYELQGDSAIWLMKHPRLGDCQLAHILRDDETGVNLIVIGVPAKTPDKPDKPDVSDAQDSTDNQQDAFELDILGTCNPANSEILDKNNERVAVIDNEDKVLNSTGKTLLRFNPNVNPVDKKLIAFFLLYHYQILHAKAINN